MLRATLPRWLRTTLRGTESRNCRYTLSLRQLRFVGLRCVRRRGLHLRFRCRIWYKGIVGVFADPSRYRGRGAFSRRCTTLSDRSSYRATAARRAAWRVPQGSEERRCRGGQAEGRSRVSNIGGRAVRVRTDGFQGTTARIQGLGA